MSFSVRLAPSADDDLERLFDHLVDRSRSLEDLAHAQRTLDALRSALFVQLAASPFSYRKAGDGRRSTRRELIISAGSTGYVALYEIETPASVVVIAIRHQREDDYH